MNILSKEDAFEVSDSTDWLETPLSLLAAVDSALRCQVCKDFYTTPMITSCSHTFCSLCIRRCLTNDGRCPVCRTEDQAMRLRNNLLVGEIVDAFKDARPKVLELARTPALLSRSVSPKRKHSSAIPEEADDSPPRKRTRSSGRTQIAQHIHPVANADVEDEEITLGDLVACPICQGRMTEAQVSIHIDSCTGEPPRQDHSIKSNRGTLKNSFRPSSPAKRFERLPQVNYSMLKDLNLRKKLTDQGLSAGGPRQLLERRYTEWVTLWNANCDAPRPKAQSELRRELEIWERTQGGRAPWNSGPSTGAHIRDKDFDGAAWVSKHNDSFQQLIEQAKQKRNAVPPVITDSSQLDVGDEQHYRNRDPSRVAEGMESNTMQKNTSGVYDHEPKDHKSALEQHHADGVLAVESSNLVDQGGDVGGNSPGKLEKNHPGHQNLNSEDTVIS